MQNPIQITTKELRDNLSEILEKIAIGKENFIVSKFGKKKAQLIPVKEVTKKISKKKYKTSGLKN